MRGAGVAVTAAMLCLAAWTAEARAWSDLGHAIICEIAFQELGAAARSEVTRLIRMDPDYRFYADSCGWPDHPKSRDVEHFVNVPRGFGTFSAAHCPTARLCLFTAIDADTRALRTPASDRARLAALKYLSHWVGDLHQPLHVSFEDDRGGTRVGATGACGTNLHLAWDVCLIERALGTRSRDVARSLRAGVTASERASWPASPVHEWANESLRIARLPSLGYCVPAGGSCAYERNNQRLDPGEPQKVVTVDGDYVRAHGPLVADRLKRAGIRLGHMLNAILGK